MLRLYFENPRKSGGAEIKTLEKDSKTGAIRITFKDPSGKLIKYSSMLTVDGYSRSLRDATGPVDVYSRIPTSMQVTCIAAYSAYVCIHVHMCTCTHELCINIA